MAQQKDLTPHHKKVLGLLRSSGKPLSAYEILDKLHDDGFRAPPTVYRALDGLIKRGLAHRIESLNAFVACHHSEGEEDHASPFAICTSCGKVDEVTDQTVLKALAKAGQKFLQQVDHKVLEISGLCRVCCAKNKKDA